MQKIGIQMSKGNMPDSEDGGVGDKICWSSLPEAFYKWYGIKLIDVKKSWIVDHNPYILRGEKGEDNYLAPLEINTEETGIGMPILFSYHEDWPIAYKAANFHLKHEGEIRNLFVLPLHTTHHQLIGGSGSNTHFRHACADIQDYAKPELDFPRGPRLYKYEDSKVKASQVAIHIGPSHSMNQLIPDSIIKTISERYSNYDIVQIGGQNDAPSPFIDKRGGSLWDMTKIIAESSIFIGINSGPMNIANCYPHINKKIILIQNELLSLDGIMRFYPRNTQKYGTAGFEGWVDYGWQYYNSTEFDLGATYSYKRI